MCVSMSESVCMCVCKCVHVCMCMYVCYLCVWICVHGWMLSVYVDYVSMCIFENVYL